MDQEEPSTLRRIGGWIWGALQVAGLVGFLLVAIFGVYHLFEARIHHRFW